MSDPKLGTKRLCESCGAKFYDLAKDPILCPKCGTVFDPSVLVRKPVAAKVVKPEEKEEEEEEDEVQELEADTIEVSLDALEDDERLFGRAHRH